jgi:hypothetical protein
VESTATDCAVFVESVPAEGSPLFPPPLQAKSPVMHKPRARCKALRGIVVDVLISWFMEKHY